MRTRAVLTASVLTLAACAGSVEPVHTGTGGRGATTATPSVSSATTAAPVVDRTRRAIGIPQQEALPVELAPMAGGASVLAIADEGERGAFARTIDASGALGKMRWFEGAHVVTAFEGRDGRTTFVTSDGDRLCVATFARDAETADARACEAARPEVVVPIGERLALLSLDITETKAPGAAKAAAKPATTKPAATATPKKKSAAKNKPKDAKKKKPKAKDQKKRKTAEKVLIPPTKAKVDVRVAWATREGAFDLAGAPSGLTFERPLSGMMLADAVPRGAGADLLFYETVEKPKTKSKTAFGSARLGIATVDAEGKLAAGTRGTLADGDLEYGFITGQNAPRLVSNGASTALVTFAGRAGACQASRVFPSLGPAVLQKASCLLDPLVGIPSPSQQTAFEQWLRAEPRRAPGQTRADGPLVAWAGDRALFVGSAGFGTASRSDAAPNPADPPFAAKRSRFAATSFAPDGEGIAVVGGKAFRIDAAGNASELPGTDAKTDLDALVEGGHFARIGDTFWLAHRDVVRLAPPMKIEVLAGHAVADATALVGGRERGLFIEVASGMLVATAIAKDGSIPAASAAPSPVRAGFAAAERAAGGAIVAGVSAGDPRKVSAFPMDGGGRSGALRPTSLAVPAGAFTVRLTALPNGGALLTDEARTRAVWLDDDANEIASADLPGEHVAAACAFGRPAPLALASPEPGKLARPSGFATAGTCIAGEVAWTASGGLRWFGTTVRGIDSIAEVGALDDVVQLAPKSIAPAASPTASVAPLPPIPTPPAASAAPAPGLPVACSGDMVSIAGKFCVDRFESTLVDAKTDRALSPDYPPTPNLLEIVLGDWATERAHWGDAHARAFPLPFLPAWQRGAKTEPLAVVRFGARPNGYATGLVAESACAAAGKRLCTLDEFTTACRGEADTDFPYGTDYQDGVCNVFRDDHPAALLHHNASLGHLDPRLNRVRAKGKPLFETAGARPACRSVWGSDAVYDLVGNLDEWIDEGTGAFAGGFYSRSTRAGCDAVITAHPKVYADYSTGVRCCKDAQTKDAQTKLTQTKDAQN